MANKYIQVGMGEDMHKDFMHEKELEDRSESKMGEILIREALATRRLLKQKVA